MANDQQKHSETAPETPESMRAAEDVTPESEQNDAPTDVAGDQQDAPQESQEDVSLNDDEQAQLALAKDEIERLKQALVDTQLRAQAEIQNVRRRAEQDVEKAHKFALDKFAQELLPVIDSLERTVQACSSEDEVVRPLREGAEMTLNLFISSVAKFNLDVVDPTGQPFDPELHQAMSMVDAPDAAPNSVVAVMQKGYTLNGRLVRPAMVMVAKG
ncbi:nucleotide exchange factor GrpE [Nitrincola schmidtii]|uniref:nucleotide exchange factor GrpE n=1 Tax=Nitrincola schmidtii TaxID=1730894 RepID=UPI001F0F12C8|nr:nucleotide exchange factor GrpE [Nitrincola schmidtii]